MKHPYLALLISLALLVSNARLCAYAQSNAPTQTPANTALNPKAEKVRKQTLKLGVGKDATVIMRNKSEYYGTLKSVEAYGFLLWDVDLKQLIEFKYDEVKKVREGYGEKNYFTGRRVNPRTDFIVGAAVIGGFLALIGIAAAGLR